MVENNRRTKLFFKIVLGQIAVGLLVTLLALFVLAFAEGNRFDLKRMKLIKTGVILLEYLPKDSQVYINDKQVKTAKSFVRNLTPGNYSFQIDKAGYSSWRTDLYIATESVNVYKKVLLFRKDAEPQPLTDERKISLLKGPNEFLASSQPNGLFSNNYEIWIGDNVVARFSTKIGQAVWYPDEAHIVYQQGKEIRVLEKNGRNDTLLATLLTDNNTVFALSSDGQELYYQDKEEYKYIRIR